MTLPAKRIRREESWGSSFSFAFSNMPEEISGGYDIARCQSFHIVIVIGF